MSLFCFFFFRNYHCSLFAANLWQLSVCLLRRLVVPDTAMDKLTHLSFLAFCLPVLLTSF